MNEEVLSLATLRYDHVADLILGKVVPEGIRLNYLELSYHDIVLRAVAFHDFDVTEISLAKYTSLRSNGDDSLIAIPVFPNRVTRHSALYVRDDGPVRSPADLAGRRVGVPEWAQTAVVYCRGLLSHYYGVDLSSIEWVQAGADEPGRTEKVDLHLPKGLRLTPVSDKSLSQMLVSGEIDAAICAQPPRCYVDRDPHVRRLFEDYFDIERAYVRETGILPVMHTIAIRKDVLDRAPWAAANLYAAFEEAKRRSVERALYTGASMYPFPWCYEYASRTKDVIGDDIFPYGVDANKVPLEAFLDFCVEQGVTSRRLQVEELFAKQTLLRVHV